MIVINSKNYLTGEKLIARAQLIEKYLPKAVLAVPAADIFEVSAETRLTIFAQHMNWQEKGRATGFSLPEDLKEAGAVGSLLNHSEHTVQFPVIKKTIEHARGHKLKIILCAASLAEVKKFIALKPWAIAYEDAQLVGSGKSITTYRTEEVKKFAAMLRGKKTIPLCGAGIQSAEDVRASKKLGCRGALIASAITAVPLKKAELFLRELTSQREGMRQ